MPGNHPFFDAARFPWDRPDARAFHDVLPTLVASQADIGRLYHSSAPGLEPLVPDAAHRMWKEALDRLAPAGGLGALCELLLARQLNPAVRSRIEAVRQARPSVDSLVGPPGGGVVILDRAVLRGHIRQLAPAGNPLKVIVVRGGPDSGKSHGRYLFELAARDHGADVIYLSADMVATVEEVVEELFGALDAFGEIPPPGETTTSAYYRQVWLKLRAVVSRRQRQLWIAIDDLGLAEDEAPLLDPEVRDLLDQLVLRLPNPVYRQWFRLMLIHYPEGKLPTKWSRDVVAEERTAEADVTADHVVEVLRSWTASAGRTVIDAEIEALAQHIVAESDAPPAGCCRLQRLHDLVSDTLESLVGERP
ncbi:hypothetical protein ACQP2F_27600 [Actinoplanes sp. CA-030573]|uniref:hypothetical protein n=1 Tax=Actinoplanes sp. CA-030573 TaxID=3239898 RepID=UPI003D8F510B